MAMIDLKIKRTTFPAYLAEPASQPKGGLVVIHEVWGLTDHIKDVADRFAAAGYRALALNLISETDLEQHMTPDMPNNLFNPKTRNEVQPVLRKIMAPIQSDEFARRTIAKLKLCVDYLTKDAALKDRLGVVGFCFGGTYSFQLAANEPRLKAAVPFYGHANFSVGQLSQINCPILAFYGEKDEALMSALPELKEHMKIAGVDFKSKVYPGCGHAFFNDTNPYAYNEAAAKDAWIKTLEFLGSRLG